MPAPRALVPVLMTALLTASGCSWRPSLPSLSDFRLPSVYRVQIQQGNVITQDMIDKLRPGMTRRQVVFIMGEPVLRNPFREDQWDYIYAIKTPKQDRFEQRVTLFFEDDKLVRFNSDLPPTDAAKSATEKADDTAAVDDSTDSAANVPAMDGSNA